MSGGAGSAGGSGGMGQQPMGNAGAQPGGGIPSYAQPYMNNLGGGMAQPYNSGAPQQSTNQSTFGQGMNTMFGGGSPFGMQQQQPYGMQPMQNPFEFQQQQRPAYMDNPDFQAYQRQEQDLGRQMNEYMQKAPMYQQIQELQGKMRGFQQPQQGQMQNPYGNIDQMQQQRNMQDQARQQRMYEQATQQDMRAAVMPQQPGSEQVADNRMGMPDYGRIDNRMGMPDYGRGGYGGGRGAFGGRMGGGFGGRGGYGRQMPQQDYGYGQMQNQMQQLAQFGQQQRQQYGGLDALQQYLQPPSYRPPVVAPLPLDPGLTMPKPQPAPVNTGSGSYDPSASGGF